MCLIINHRYHLKERKIAHRWPFNKGWSSYKEELRKTARQYNIPKSALYSIQVVNTNTFKSDRITRVVNIYHAMTSKSL